MADDSLRGRTHATSKALLSAEKIEEILENGLDTWRNVTCASCGRHNRVPMPNVELLLRLIESTEGKVAEPERKVVVDVTHRTLRELPDAELAAIADGRAVVDGEWVELGQAELPPSV